MFYINRNIHHVVSLLFVYRYIGCQYYFVQERYNVINLGVMVCMLEPRSGQTKDYEIGICCFSAKHAALRRKSNDWLTRNQDNVSEWGEISIHGLLFQ
jgi:hypothetical protein